MLRSVSEKSLSPLLLGVLCAFGTAIASGGMVALDAEIRTQVAAAKLKGASVGLAVIDVQTGRLLCAVDEAKPLTPASNVKLITTGVALLLLGPKFQFTTEIYGTGVREEEGVLPGDLVVVAGGDPAISGRHHGGKTTAVLDDLAVQVARKIQVVTGNLVIDDTIFDREYVHPSWPQDQLVRWYCAPISAFALNDNCVDVSVVPGTRAGDPARVKLDPPTNYFTVDNRCTTIASGQGQAIIHRLPRTDTLVISGKLPLGSPGAASPVAVSNPVRYAATVLRERLAQAGVRIHGQIVLADRPVDLAGMEQLASASHSLLDAIQVANKRSQNFYAEMILKTLGRRAGQPSSFAKGAEIVTAYLHSVGIKPETFTLDDGSGLSKKNAFSARQIASFLRHMARSEHANTFLASLAVAGVDGTLSRRMTQPPCAGKILAKTGSVSGASALSGYVKAGSSLLAFSILINGAELDRAAAHALQDTICGILAGSIE